MRIIAGELRHRIVEMVPGETTRPTLDRIKESIFNKIGPYFDGGKMLDLFGGSGNIGFEALSRGMETCVFVDMNMAPIQTIKKNAANLKVQNRCRILKMDYQKALEELQEESFHLCYIDPPYAKQQIDGIMMFLDEHNMIEENGIVICESGIEDVFADNYGSLTKYYEKEYRVTRVTMYRKEEK